MTKEAWDEMVAKDKKRYDEIIELLQRNIFAADIIPAIVKEIFDMGFNEGQQYVWFARSGFGETEEEWLERHHSTKIVATVNGINKTFKVKEDGTWEEIIDNEQN